MKTLHKLLISSAMVSSTIAVYASTQASNLTIDDYCDVKIAAPAGVKEMTPMPDGVSYA